MVRPRRLVRFERSSIFQPVYLKFKSVKGSLKRAYKKMTTSVKGSLKKAYKKMTTVENWTKTVLFVCVVALAIDPLFFFIPVIDSQRFCFTLDKKLAAAVGVLRTSNDTFYVIHIIFHLCAGLIAPRNEISTRGEITVHSDVVRERFPFSYFIVDIVSVLPIPQVLVLVLIQTKQQAGSLVTKEILKWVIFCQYIPRSIRIYPVLQEVTRASGTVSETKWKGAVLNLFLYLLPSQVIGALWYLIAIETKDRCWREACSKKRGCNLTSSYCPRGGGNNGLFLNTTCPLTAPEQITDDTVFNFGMYVDALKSRVVESRDFPRKFFYCFRWGLRNLSALGQNLETSSSVGELIFALIICVSGLLLFAVLIGNVQKYLQSNTIRVDEMEEKKRDTEKWMSHRMLPELAKNRIRSYEKYKWSETRGIEDEAILGRLPKDLRLETKLHLYKNLLSCHPFLRIMADGWLLEALCDRVKSVFYSAKSYVVKEGAPVEEMLFITKGKLESITRSTELIGYYNSVILEAGDICGDLLSWVLDGHTSSRLPTSNTTILTLTDVEGFFLSPDDLKFVASHFSHSHSNNLKHMYKYFSRHWQLWAACYLQAAWREHCIRKRSKIFLTEKDKPQTLQNTQLNLSETLHVSRYTQSKSLRNRHEHAAASSPLKRLPLALIPRKPADPDFSKYE